MIFSESFEEFRKILTTVEFCLCRKIKSINITRSKAKSKADEAKNMNDDTWTMYVEMDVNAKY